MMKPVQMNEDLRNLQKIKQKIEDIEYENEGFLDEIIVYGQEALWIIKAGSSIDEEKQISEAVRSAKKMREDDPLMITRNKIGILRAELIEGLNKAIEKLE